VVCACNPSYLEGRDRRIVNSRSAQAKVERLCFKNKTKNKRAGGMAQVVEHIPTYSVSKTLDSGSLGRGRSCRVGGVTGEGGTAWCWVEFLALQ
jgi:hypothetical protein